ncbi:MAG: helix-turn-helix domain-containing protein [Candidatus Nitrosopolaris sp.]
MVPIELKRMLTCGKDFCLLDVLVDNEQAARVAGNEFYRSRWWAYKWLKRFADSGLEGLKNLPRTGRPPEVSKERFAQIERVFTTTT